MVLSINRYRQVAILVSSSTPALVSLELTLPPAECERTGRDPTQRPHLRHMSGGEPGGVAAEWPGDVAGSGGGSVHSSWRGTPGSGQRHSEGLQKYVSKR